MSADSVWEERHDPKEKPQFLGFHHGHELWSDDESILVKEIKRPFPFDHRINEMRLDFQVTPINGTS